MEQPIRKRKPLRQNPTFKNPSTSLNKQPHAKLHSCICYSIVLEPKNVFPSQTPHEHAVFVRVMQHNLLQKHGPAMTIDTLDHSLSSKLPNNHQDYSQHPALPVGAGIIEVIISDTNGDSSSVDGYDGFAKQNATTYNTQGFCRTNPTRNHPFGDETNQWKDPTLNQQ